MKTCEKCKKQKQVSDFYKQNKTADGLGNKCKTCSKISTQSSYKLLLAANPDQNEQVLWRRKKGNGRAENKVKLMTWKEQAAAKLAYEETIGERIDDIKQRELDKQKFSIEAGSFKLQEGETTRILGTQQFKRRHFR